MKNIKYVKEHFAQIMATIIASAVISAAGAIVSVKINDARQDIKIGNLENKIDNAITKIDKLGDYLIEKLGD